MAKTTERVSHAADTAKPYVDRALHDEELRENVKRAVIAARLVYEDLMGPRGVTGIAHRIATDQDMQSNLRTAADELARAARRLQAHERHKARNTMLLLTGITVAFLYNPWTGAETRRWIKQQLFGDGEFGYTEPTDNSGLPTPNGG